MTVEIVLKIDQLVLDWDGRDFVGIYYTEKSLKYCLDIVIRGTFQGMEEVCCEGEKESYGDFKMREW